MEINWKNIHYYILVAILLNFFMLYCLKDNSENIMETENIIEITPEQANFLLAKHLKKEEYEKGHKKEEKRNKNKEKSGNKEKNQNKGKKSNKEKIQNENNKRNFEKINKALNETKKKENISYSDVAEAIGRSLGEGEKPIPFHQIQSFLDELYINKEIHTDKISITNEEFTKENFAVAVFSVIFLIIIAVVATYFQFRNQKRIKNEKEGNINEISYLLME